MNITLLKTSLPTLACGVLLTQSARAEDYCELFANRDFTGSAATLALPPVIATLATGAPSDSAWASTSRRFSSSDLAALDNRTSAARVRALDSDVALYLLDGGDLNGKGSVFFCKQGFACTLELGSDMNDRTSSVICQREFFRKAMLRDPNADPTRAYFTALLNPIFELAMISKAADAVAHSAFAGDDGIDAYRAAQSEDGWGLWSRTTWLTGHGYCKRFDASCQRDPSEKYRDLFRISKRFEIDVNGFWADFTPFLDDDYVIQADWFIRPVITDWDNDPSTSDELRFWWARTEVWIEDGRLHDAIAPNAERTIFDVDIQQGLRELFVLGAAYAGCPQCIDGKKRLQFSVYATDPARSVWLEPFNMDLTEPKLVLNDSRDAIYDD